jgi:hypothetical protein
MAPSLSEQRQSVAPQANLPSPRPSHRQRCARSIRLRERPVQDGLALHEPSLVHSRPEISDQTERSLTSAHPKINWRLTEGFHRRNSLISAVVFEVIEFRGPFRGRAFSGSFTCNRSKTRDLKATLARLFVGAAHSRSTPSLVGEGVDFHAEACNNRATHNLVASGTS